MSELILPEHVARKMQKLMEAVKNESTKDSKDSKNLENAYVEPKDVVFDPNKLDKSVIERLPQPTGWRILILPYRGPAKTKGDVYLPEEFVERQSLATVVAYVLAVGPDAYADTNKFPAGPWCKKGDWVLIGRYAGARFKIEGGEVRIINDDEVIATIIDPADVMSV